MIHTVKSKQIWQIKKSEIELGAFFKKSYDRVLDKLHLKRAQIIDIQKAVTCADLNKDNKIDFIEWRNSLRTKGYGDIEIEALFSKYDLDGDRCLNEEEQKNMLKDLAEQNEELKLAYLQLDQEKENEIENEQKRKKRADGVPFEDYSLLSQRVDKMENSVGQINSKIDSVLNKLDKYENKNKSRTVSASKSKQDIRGFSANSQSYC
jgi:polycystin 2